MQRTLTLEQKTNIDQAFRKDMLEIEASERLSGIIAKMKRLQARLRTFDAREGEFLKKDILRYRELIMSKEYASVQPMKIDTHADTLFVVILYIDILKLELQDAYLFYFNKSNDERYNHLSSVREEIKMLTKTYEL